MKLTEFSLQAAMMGVFTAFVGFTSTFAIMLQGLRAVGADPTQSASGLMALCVGCGLCGLILSIATRVPISVAWSTPGAALLATSVPPSGGFAEAVGAFLMCAACLTVSGLVPPIRKIVSAIPSHLANAMLAGILVTICFAPVKAIALDPLIGGAILGAWLIAGTVNRALAVPAALLAFVTLILVTVDIPEGGIWASRQSVIPDAVLTAPQFTLPSFLNIAIPLFVVTMASQNIPGIAIMASAGFRPRAGLWLTSTGISSAISALFGAHALNMASVTAAMAAGPDAHPDSNRRYWAAIVGGLGWISFGVLSGGVIAFVTLAPGIFIQAVAGLALIPVMISSLRSAFDVEKTREASALTLLFSAAGVTIFGVSGAFWGLVVGWAVTAIKAPEYAWALAPKKAADGSAAS